MIHMNTAGYNLLEISHNIWCLEVADKDQNFVGTFREVVLYSLFKGYFDIEEINVAVQTMLEEGHNSAHFGMNKFFLFTFNRTTPMRKAS